MTPEQWARVFAAGATVANKYDDQHPVAAIVWALDGMRAECKRLAEEEG